MIVASCSIALIAAVSFGGPWGQGAKLKKDMINQVLFGKKGDREIALSDEQLIGRVHDETS